MDVSSTLLSTQNAAREERTYINKQVLPQAPSPTMTSFRRISAMVADGYLGLKTGEREREWMSG